MPTTPDRRTFITALGGVAAFATSSAVEPAQAPAQPAPGGAIDIGWFDAFKGKHKQVFDLQRFDLSLDTPLRQVMTYLAAHREINKLDPPDDINAVVGISHKAFPMNAADALWEKYALGEHWRIKDPATGKPSVRNIFMDGPVAGPATVRALQGRGVVFWQCSMALTSISAELAAKTGGKAADIRADLVAGLRTGVRLVPAHTWAVGFAQERGFTYMSL
ncbi:MAG: hypothetical protein AB7Q16_09315 [Vicinamibacterales bacterium]